VRVRWASVAAPGRRANEDQALHAGDLVGVFDGVTVPAGLDCGCAHGPAWYVRRLAARLVAAARPEVPLPDALAAAIDAVRADHGGGCDLGHPGTPAATVTLWRSTGEYLLLGDSPLVVDGGRVLVDERFDRAVADLRGEVLASALPVGSAGHAALVRDVVTRQRARTNRPDGYWIAAADPAAAAHAVTGTVRTRRVGLFTDGAFEPLRHAGLTPGGMLDLAGREGPAALIRRAHGAAVRPGYKLHDDATVVVCG
jgi:hypothetical protein